MARPSSASEKTEFPPKAKIHEFLFSVRLCMHRMESMEFMHSLQSLQSSKLYWRDTWRDPMWKYAGNRGMWSWVMIYFLVNPLKEWIDHVCNILQQMVIGLLGAPGQSVLPTPPVTSFRGFIRGTAPAPIHLLSHWRASTVLGIVSKRRHVSVTSVQVIKKK